MLYSVQCDVTRGKASSIEAWNTCSACESRAGGVQLREAPRPGSTSGKVPSLSLSLRIYTSIKGVTSLYHSRCSLVTYTTFSFE